LSARRFFIEGLHRSGDCVEIGGGDARKIRRVLRLRNGDAVEVIDSAGTAFTAAVEIDGTRVRANLSKELEPAEDRVEASARFDVAQALPKGQKMDFVVEKVTELGAEAILPFSCERAVVRLAANTKVERWRRLAESAALQCGRRCIPQVAEPLKSFEALLERFDEYDAVLFAWELAPRIALSDTLPDLLNGAGRVLLVLGPEGGFTHDEAAAAQARGAALVWMGPRILRAETAAVAFLAIADAFAQGRNLERARRRGAC
jgi:16S rRNA (uracil1498-N3)-methyltransferase